MIILKRSVVHKNDNSALHYFWVIALYYFSNLIFVQSIPQKAFEISTWNFIGGLRRCAVHRVITLPYSSNKQTHSVGDGHVNMASMLKCYASFSYILMLSLWSHSA
jgi:hypothetical protein